MSAPETFKAHLIGFRSFGTSTTLAGSERGPLIPAAILRMADGKRRAVVDYGVVSRMLSKEDHEFIHEVWERAYPRLYATVSQGDLPMPEGSVPGGSYGDFNFKPWTAAAPKFNATPAHPTDSYCAHCTTSSICRMKSWER